MINKYLIDAYDEYQENKTYNILIEFAEKTFKNQGKQKLFIGCALILITNVTSKYYATTHALLSILESGKEKNGNTNLLQIYYERINTNKDISKYLKDAFSKNEYDKNLDELIDYYKFCSFDFRKIMNSHQDKIDKYI